VRSALVALAFAWSCHGTPSAEPPEQPASPQAKAEPAPVINPPATAASTPALSASSSAGAPFLASPQQLRPDEAPAADAFPREGQKEAPPTYTLTMVMRPSDIALPPKGLDLSPQGLDAARHKTEPTLSVDLTSSHARAVLTDGFVLPPGTEIRVRADRYGYIVVSPDAASYRVAATGSMRALLGEGLFDVAPSAQAEVAPRGEGPKRLTRTTRRVEVATRAGRAVFEIARVPEVGDGGVLFCRILLDLMSAAPATSVCLDGDVPMHVELKWSAQPPSAPAVPGRLAGSSIFDAVALVRRTDALPSTFLAPPTSSTFSAAGEPVRGSRMFLEHSDILALHPGEPPPHGGNAPTLTLRNSTDELRYAWLDGVPLAWLAPGARLEVSGVPHGRAFVQWRTFLGDAIDPGQLATLPQAVDVGVTPVTSADSPLP
jgi:hypothetical protein